MPDGGLPPSPLLFQRQLSQGRPLQPSLPFGGYGLTKAAGFPPPLALLIGQRSGGWATLGSWQAATGEGSDPAPPLCPEGEYGVLRGDMAF